MKAYIGHDSQLYGIEEHRLVGGKGEGMRLLEVNNGKGLQMTILPDRAADISRLKLFGINMGFFPPSGYVAPSYYDSTGTNWLKSFSGGFLTTCGLENVGVPCVDNGESLPLHGSIANIPADNCYYYEENNKLIIKALMKDENLFARKLRLNREISVALDENTFLITDIIENTGDTIQPFEILYHLNMGYPLLDEDSVVNIPYKKVEPRDEDAANGFENCLIMEKPQKEYREKCYYHQLWDTEDTQTQSTVSIYQPKLNIGISITFDSSKLDCFTEWKMMGYRDYVLGLECGNCYPDGRDVTRKKGILKFIKPNEKITYSVLIKQRGNLHNDYA